MSDAPILDRINTFCNQWPRAEYGPAHVVLSDYNLWDGNLIYCLNEIGQGTSAHAADELAATARFLRDLLAVPEADRVAAMEAYWGPDDE